MADDEAARRPISLRLRLAALATVGALIVLSAGAVFLYQGLTREISSTLTDELAIRIADLPAGINGGETASGNPLVTAQVVNLTGTVRHPAGADPLLTDNELARASREQIVVDREVAVIGEHARLVARPLSVEGTDVVGIAATSSAPLARARDLLVLVLAVAGPLLAIGVGFAAWAVTGAALRPVRRMTSEAATISAADVGRRLPQPAGKDEIAELGHMLNGMLDRIESSVTRERAFIDDAAHELRTPIAVLRGELELATYDPHDAQAISQSLASALEETDRLGYLADGLLTLARADAGELVPGDATTELRTAVDEAVRRVTSSDELTIETRGCQTMVRAEPEWVKHIVSNLVTNAQRHARGRIEISIGAEGESGRLVVADDGPGFPSDLLPRVFDRFARADSTRGQADGAGLGLAIVTSLVHALGGTVDADNGPPLGGARIEVTLPLAAAERSHRHFMTSERL